MSDLSPEEVVDEGLVRLREELDCCLEHFANHEFAQITAHMANMSYGCQVLAQTLVQHLLGQDEIIGLMQQKLQEMLGAPVEFIGEAGEMLGFHVINVQAPNDLSELDDDK